MAKTYETSCVLSLRVINAAQGTYSSEHPEKGYASTLGELGPAGDQLLESVIVSGKKDGYLFRLVPNRKGVGSPVKYYSVAARPLRRLVNDQLSFYTDETGVIRFTAENRAARISDPPLDSASR
jgi:hypothetical protein